MKKNFQEFEVKFAISDVNAFKERLKQTDATLIKDVRQIDEYLDDDKLSLFSRDVLLRIRQEFDAKDRFLQGELSWKGAARGKDIEIREDRSLTFEDQESMKKIRLIMSRLGYEPFITFLKHRERWNLQDARYNIDLEFDKRIQGMDKSGVQIELGAYCQASLETAEYIDDDNAIDLLWKKIESLGYNRKQYEPLSYIQLYINKKNDKR